MIAEAATTSTMTGCSAPVRWLDTTRGYFGRRAVCEMLGRGGLHASELSALRIGHVRVQVLGYARSLQGDGPPFDR
jgi:hypothetical protein